MGLFLLIPSLFLNTDIAFPKNFDGDSAFTYLTMQTDIGPRNPGSAGHRACLKLLQGQLEKHGALVTLQPFMYYDVALGKSFTMNNIIGSFSPEKTSRILLCAHWDTRPFADRDVPENRNIPIPGANDGASGVAVLLELARQFSLKPPPVGIDIVFFDGEDYGEEGDLENYCLGSRYFIKANNRYFPRFAILLDMIGDSQFEIPIEGYSYQFVPELVNRLWQTAAELEVYEFIPEQRHYVFDDHVILNQGGIPAIDIIDFEYPDASHRYWHTLEDTPDKCSPESLEKVGKVLMHFIYRLQP